MRNTLMAASALALLAGAANAASMSYTESATLGLTTNPLSTTLSVAAFNASLGTLTGVSVLFEGSTVASLNLACLSGFSCTWTTADSGSSLSISGPDISSIISLTPTGSPSVPLTINDSTPGTTTASIFGGTDNANQLSFTGLTGSDSDTASPVDFAAYDGVGETTVDFNVAGSNTTLVGATGPQQSSGQAASDLTITITYTYDSVSDVPVPAALPLMASAFGILGLARLRRKG